MAYCGKCDGHNVTFTKVENGYYCNGCEETYYYDEEEKEQAILLYNIIVRCKNEGKTTYGIFDEPIEEALEDAKFQLERLGISTDLNQH